MPLPARQGAHAIVLAAGASRRFGGCKLAEAYRGRPLIHWAAAAALRAEVETVTVILGASADRVRAALAGIDDARLRMRDCARWEDGLSASLICGVDSLPEDARAAVIFLGDMPHVDDRLASALLALVLDGAPAAVPVHPDGVAHPVAISAGLFPAVKSLTGDKGARGLLDRLDGVARLPVTDAGSITDIDSRPDLLARQPDGLGQGA